MLLRPQIDSPPRRTADKRRDQRRGGDPAEHEPRIFEAAGGNLPREQPAVKSDQRRARHWEQCPDHPCYAHLAHCIPAWHFACNAPALEGGKMLVANSDHGALVALQIR